MVTRAELHAAQARGMSEEELQRKVMGAAADLGWKTWHPTISIYSKRGWPDLVLAHPKRGRIMFRELKKETGDVSPSQQEWLATLTACGMDAAVWRPLDWVTGRITKELQP